MQRNRSESFVFAGLRHLDANRLEEALASFGAAVAIEPSNPRANLYLGVALARQGHYDEAVQACTIALQADSRIGAVHTFTGLIHLDFGRPELAIDAFRRTLRLESGNMIAEASIHLGEWDLGNPAGKERLLFGLRWMPFRVRARLAARLDAKTDLRHNNVFAQSPETPTPKDRSTLRALEQNIRKWHLSRIQRHIRREKYEAALDYALWINRARCFIDADLKDLYVDALLMLARAGGVAVPEMKDHVKRLAAPRTREPRTPDADERAARRHQLTEIARYLDPLDQTEARRRLLQEWLRQFHRAHEPRNEFQAAAYTLAQLARLELANGNLIAARRSIEASFKYLQLREQLLTRARIEWRSGKGPLAICFYEQYIEKDVTFLPGLLNEETAP